MYYDQDDEADGDTGGETDREIANDLRRPDPLDALLDWVLELACIEHDCSNAVRKSLERKSSASIVKDLHIVLESLRNSFTGLERNLMPFLVKHLRFEDLGVSEGDQLALWLCLKAPLDTITLLLELGLHWKDGYLYVNKRTELDPECVTKLMVAILALLGWQEFM